MDPLLNSEEIEGVRNQLECEEDFFDLALFFKIFSDETRLRIIQTLAVRSMCVSDICAVLELSQSSVSHQLATLRKMRLVRTTKAGKSVIYALSDHHIMTIFSSALEHIKE
mgnify:CR=1 FL=1